MANASGVTSNGDPYIRVFLSNGILRSGDSIVQTLDFKGRRDDGRPRYTLNEVTGSGSSRCSWCNARRGVNPGTFLCCDALYTVADGAEEEL